MNARRPRPSKTPPPAAGRRNVVALSLVVLGLGVLTLATGLSRTPTTIPSTASQSQLPEDSTAGGFPVSREDHTLSPKPKVLLRPFVQGKETAPVAVRGEREFTKGPTETICTEDGCVGPKYAEEETRELLARNPTRFSPEEIEILEKYTVDGLGRAVMDAESPLLKSDDQTRSQLSIVEHLGVLARYATPSVLPRDFSASTDHLIACRG